MEADYRTRVKILIRELVEQILAGQQSDLAEKPRVTIHEEGLYGGNLLSLWLSSETIRSLAVRWRIPFSELYLGIYLEFSHPGEKRGGLWLYTRCPGTVLYRGQPGGWRIFIHFSVGAD